MGKTTLRSRNVYWDANDRRIKAILDQSNNNGIESLNDEDKNYLIKELDRRLVQFWDKVDYENKLSRSNCVSNIRISEAFHG